LRGECRSPPPSALRVSHPLDGFLLPEPSGLVSSRYARGVLAFRALILPKSRSPLGVASSPAVGDRAARGCAGLGFRGLIPPEGRTGLGAGLSTRPTSRMPSWRSIPLGLSVPPRWKSASRFLLSCASAGHPCGGRRRALQSVLRRGARHLRLAAAPALLGFATLSRKRNFRNASRVSVPSYT